MRFLLFVIFSSSFPIQAGDIVIIGHANVPKIDVATVQKIYTGKFISVEGVNVTPVALKAGTPQREQFLQMFMNQDEEKYTAYWTVRHYVGKGTPPNEFENSVEVIRFVQSTPGAIGYVDESEIKENVHVISRNKN